MARKAMEGGMRNRLTADQRKAMRAHRRRVTWADPRRLIGWLTCLLCLRGIIVLMDAVQAQGLSVTSAPIILLVMACVIVSLAILVMIWGMFIKPFWRASATLLGLCMLLDMSVTVFVRGIHSYADVLTIGVAAITCFLCARVALFLHRTVPALAAALDAEAGSL